MSRTHRLRRSKVVGRNLGLYGMHLGNADNVIYLVDASGSMIRVFDEVRAQLIHSVNRLRTDQQFQVILSGGGKTLGYPSGKLAAATSANKNSVVQFFNSKKARPSGNTNVLAALKHVFKTLPPSGKATADKSTILVLVTDGTSAQHESTGKYKGKTGIEAVAQWLRDNNWKENEVDQRVRVFGVLCGDDADAAKAMKQITKDNGGRLRQIQHDRKPRDES